MGKFVGQLNSEIESVTDYFEPISGVAENETVIGEMTEFQKKLYTLSSRISRQLAEGLESVFKDWQETVKPEQTISEVFHSIDELKNRTRVPELHEKLHALTDLLYVDIGEETGVWEKPKGVRRGFVVVVIEDEEKQSIT